MMNAELPLLRMRSLAGAGLLVALSLATWTTPAAAQHVCQGDAFRLCNEFVPDRAKVASCLFKNKRQLSPACRTEMGGGKAKVGKSRKGKRHGRRHRRR